MNHSRCFITAFALIQALTSSIALSDDSSGYPTLVGGALWNSLSRIEIKEGETVYLASNTTIDVDVLSLSGTIVTLGNDLRIEARKLVFGPNGKIIAFDGPAAGMAQAKQGGGGFNATPRKESEIGIDGMEGGKGGDGHNGEKGNFGAGHPSSTIPILGRIKIFAGTIDGIASVNGTGQSGGTGQTGGIGGKGGTGGKGGRAEKKCIGDDKNPGRGGKGGKGGTGGIGGEGGDGGTAVQIVFMQAKRPDGVAFNITSAPGAGGAPGTPGSGGPGGEPGAQGEGDTDCIGRKKDDSTGNHGRGDSGVIPVIAGNPGRSGQYYDPKDPEKNLIEKSFNNLDSKRVEVFNAWHDFHWTRTLLFLTLDSLRITSTIERSRNSTRSDPSANSDQISKALAQRVSANWKEFFIAPLYQELKKNPGDTRHKLMQAYSSGIRISKAFDEAASGSREEFSKIISTIMAGIEKEFGTKLDTAVSRCEFYNRNLRTGDAKALDAFWGITSYFDIPVCNGDPDFLQIGNQEKDIRLVSANNARVSGMAFGIGDLGKRLEIIAPQLDMPANTGLLERFINGLMPSAWAASPDNISVIMVGNQAIPVKQLIDGIPNGQNVVTDRGVLEGFRAITADTVTISNLGIHLRVLSAIKAAKATRGAR